MWSDSPKQHASTLVTVGLVTVGLVATLAATATQAQSAPTAPTRDQRALKVLAEARDLVAAGRPDESVPFYGHALDLAEAESDEPSVALANLLAEYGEVLRGAGLLERARVSLERSLAMIDALVDDGDPQLATPLLALGRLDADEARCGEARERLTRGLELLGDADDARSSAAASVSDRVSASVAARVALGRCAETVTSRPDADVAYAHYRDAVLAAREAGVESPEVATAMHQGAAILLARGESGPAAAYFEQAHTLRRELLGPSHWQTADTAHQLARALDQEGRRAEARTIADEAVQALGRACAPTSQSAAEVRDLCGDLGALRRELAGPPPKPVPVAVSQTQADEPPPPAQPQTRFRAQTQARAQTQNQETRSQARPTGTIWRVQVSSQQSPAEAERVAERTRSQFPGLLRAHKLNLERAELPSGVWHRVLFGEFPERDGAVALCEALKQAGLEACLPSRSGG